MSFVGKNIKKIRTIKGLSQAAFAKLFDITRASIGAYEEGRAEPKTEVMLQIAKHFSIPVEALLTKELTVNQLARFDIKEFLSESSSIGHKTLQIVTKDQWEAFLQGSNEALPEMSVPAFLFEADYLIQMGEHIIGEFAHDTYFLASQVPEPINNGVYLVVQKGQPKIIRYHGQKLTQVKQCYILHRKITPMDINLSSFEERLRNLEIHVQSLEKKVD